MTTSGDSHEQRRARARCALEGLSVGDAFGEQFFRHRPALLGMPAASSYSDLRHLPLGRPPWRWTDDTAMALSIVATLDARQGIDPDYLAREFSARYVAEPRRGYGPAMHDLLPQLHHPGAWQSEPRTLFGGQGSLGNGAPMRVAPLGAYFADDLDAAVEHARRSAVVTHTHDEAVAGAIAVAVAAALAWQSMGRPAPQPREFMARVHALTPASEVASLIGRALDFRPETTVRAAADMLGSGQKVTSQDTVPFVIWVAAGSLDNYEAALCRTVCGLGDVDTTCAMVGGIVAMYTGGEAIPSEWRRNRERLPNLPGD
jgi:ADP-ribosylglycohydrolase